MENLGYKVGDVVIILGNAPTRAEITGNERFGMIYKLTARNDAEGYLGITFYLKNHYDEYKQLLTDKRFEPTIKRDTDPIYFGNMQIGRHDKVILRWGK